MQAVAFKNAGYRFHVDELFHKRGHATCQRRRHNRTCTSAGKNRYLAWCRRPGGGPIKKGRGFKGSRRDPVPPYLGGTGTVPVFVPVSSTAATRAILRRPTTVPEIS